MAAILPAKSYSLLRSTATVSSMTLLSRVFGFVRDMVIAQMFGATAAVDAFLTAFKFPNFMRRLFAEGAFSQAFVPMLSEYRELKQHGDIKQFINHVSGNLTLILFVVTLIGVIAAPLVISIFAAGFTHGEPRYVMAVSMLRITFPYLLFISLTAFSGAILNTYGEFAIPAFTPVLLNICMIVAAIYLSPYFANPIEACAWGVFIAGVVQLAIQIPFLYRLQLLPKPVLNWSDPSVKRLLKQMVPALFGVSVAQINLFLDLLFATFLSVGSVSWLYYSDRLMNFPLGVFGVAIATVILPHLSRQHAANSADKYSQALDWGIRMILLIAIPSTIGLVCLAGPLMATLFRYGQFHAHDALMASYSLRMFALGVPMFMLIKVLASGFYAQQNIKTPVKIAAIAMILNIGLNFLLIKPLLHAGLALATTLASTFNAMALLSLLRRQNIFKAQPGWGWFSVQLTLASSLMLLFLYSTTASLDTWLQWSWHTRVWHLAYAVIGAMLCYSITLIILGLRKAQLRHY